VFHSYPLSYLFFCAELVPHVQYNGGRVKKCKKKHFGGMKNIRRGSAWAQCFAE
jgi:hypothetical protein